MWGVKQQQTNKTNQEPRDTETGGRDRRGRGWEGKGTGSQARGDGGTPCGQHTTERAGARQHGVRLRSLLPATGVTALIEKRERPPPGSRQVTLSFSRTALSEDAAFPYEEETKHS